MLLKQEELVYWADFAHRAGMQSDVAGGTSLVSVDITGAGLMRNDIVCA